MDAVDELLGESPQIVALRDRLRRLLAMRRPGRALPPVLITGETGTGKGLVARVVHRAGPRSGGPLVSVNCAAIPESMLEAELFGYERGAFTDARQSKPGLFQTASGGTLFLDEVGLLPEALQAKLLDVLENPVVRRLGSVRPEAVDIWIVAATNADLPAARASGRFREDLYHRLSVVNVPLPPLRERGGDIVMLADHFLARACAEYGIPRKRLSPAGSAALAAHRWPGNLRELANVIERAALLHEGLEVDAEALNLPLVSDTPPRVEEVAGEPSFGSAATRAPDGAGRSPAPEHSGENGRVDLREALGRVERERLLEALKRAQWNVSWAAELLGMPRNTLRYRMIRHGLRSGKDVIRRRPASGRAGTPAPRPSPARNGPRSPDMIPDGGHEARAVTVLRVTADAASTAGAPGLADALRRLEEKVVFFGGRVAARFPEGFDAAFGLEPVEDAPSRAASAALSIRKLLEHGRRESSGIGGRVSVHTGQCLVGNAADGPRLEAASLGEMQQALADLLERAGADDIVISGSTASLIERRFMLRAAEDRPRA